MALEELHHAPSVIAEDEPTSVGLRQAARPVQLEPITTRLDERLGAFAKVDASDTVGHGGMIVHRFEDREAEDLVANHPGVTTGPFEGVTIGRCRKRLLEHERPI